MGLVLILATKSKKKISRYALGTLLILAALTLLNDLIVNSGLANRYNSLYYLPIYYSLSIGPLFYTFTKSMVFEKFLLKKESIHFILPLLQLMLYLSIGFLSVDIKSSLWRNSILSDYFTIESFLFPISLLFYTHKAQKLIRQEDKNPSKSAEIMSWLAQFSKGGILFSWIELVYAISILGVTFFQVHTYPYNLLIHSAIISIFLVWISFNAYRYIFDLQKVIHLKEKKIINEEEALELHKIAERVDNEMKTKNLFLNTELDLLFLQEHMKIPRKSISKAINFVYNKNFNQFVNELRINEFKQRILKGEQNNHTLLGIAYECGFDSKTTFYRVFKKVEGKSPSEFIKLLRL